MLCTTGRYHTPKHINIQWGISKIFNPIGKVFINVKYINSFKSLNFIYQVFKNLQMYSLKLHKSLNLCQLTLKHISSRNFEEKFIVVSLYSHPHILYKCDMNVCIYWFISNTFLASCNQKESQLLFFPTPLLSPVC